MLIGEPNRQRTHENSESRVDRQGLSERRVRMMLRGVTPFRDLPSDEFNDLARSALASTFRPGEQIHGAGEPARSMHALVEGRIALGHRIDGRRRIQAFVQPQHAFAIAPYFTDLKYQSAAWAIETCTIVTVSYSRINAALENSPAFAFGMMRLLAYQAHEAAESLADVNLLDVPGRTAKRLLEFAGAENDFDLEITQQQLAELIGSTRERVNKLLAQLTCMGILTHHRKSYKILNRSHLIKLASGTVRLT